MQKLNKNVISLAILVLLGASAGMFFAGMHYQQSKASASDNSSVPGAGGRAAQFAGRNGGNGPNGGGFATGTILSKDNNTITVKMQDGSSKIIYYSGSTQIGKTDSGSASDLQNGDQVMVAGSNNPDGSVAAQNIEIRPAGSPAFFGGGGGRNGGGNGGGSQSN